MWLRNLVVKLELNCLDCIPSLKSPDSEHCKLTFVHSSYSVGGHESSRLLWPQEIPVPMHDTQVCHSSSAIWHLLWQNLRCITSGYPRENPGVDTTQALCLSSRQRANWPSEQHSEWLKEELSRTPQLDQLILHQKVRQVAANPACHDHQTPHTPFLLIKLFTITSQNKTCMQLSFIYSNWAKYLLHHIAAEVLDLDKPARLGKETKDLVYCFFEPAFNLQYLPTKQIFSDEQADHLALVWVSHFE